MPHSLALRFTLLGSTYLIPSNIWLHLQRNDRFPMNSELRANQVPLHVQRWLPGCWGETQPLVTVHVWQHHWEGEKERRLAVCLFIMYYTYTDKIKIKTKNDNSVIPNCWNVYNTALFHTQTHTKKPSILHVVHMICTLYLWRSYEYIAHELRTTLKVLLTVLLLYSSWTFI